MYVCKIYMSSHYTCGNFGRGLSSVCRKVGGVFARQHGETSVGGCVVGSGREWCPIKKDKILNLIYLAPSSVRERGPKKVNRIVNTLNGYTNDIGVKYGKTVTRHRVTSVSGIEQYVRVQLPVTPTKVKPRWYLFRRSLEVYPKKHILHKSKENVFIDPHPNYPTYYLVKSKKLLLWNT